jgi:hypothetical protein
MSDVPAIPEVQSLPQIFGKGVVGQAAKLGLGMMADAFGEPLRFAPATPQPASLALPSTDYAAQGYDTSTQGYDTRSVEHRGYQAATELGRNVTPVLEALKEWVEVRTGTRGDPLGRAVTLRDLSAIGNLSAAQTLSVLNNAGIQVSALPPGSIPGFVDSTTESDTPPAPTNLVAAGTLNKVILDWQSPVEFYSKLAFYEVWRSTTNSISTATRIGDTKARVYTDGGAIIGASYFYWVRAASTVAGVFSAYNAFAGTPAAPGRVGNSDLSDLVITADKLASGAVNALDKFAAGLEPVYNVSILPNPSGYTGPKTVYLSTDGKLYRYVSGAWTSSVPAVDVAGQISSTQIADNSITTPKLVANAVVAANIAADAVTANKIQAGAVVAGKLAADSVVAANIAADAVTANKIQAGAVVAGKIAANAIVAGDGAIANAAITNALIATAAVDTAKIADASITNAKIAALAVGTANIQDGSILTAKIQDASITTAKIAALAVGAANIQDAAITNAKIAALAVGTANIQNAAINTAQVGSLNASVIQAGTITTGKIAVGAVSAIQEIFYTQTGVSIPAGTTFFDFTTNASGPVVTFTPTVSFVNVIMQLQLTTSWSTVTNNAAVVKIYFFCTLEPTSGFASATSYCAGNFPVTADPSNFGFINALSVPMVAQITSLTPGVSTSFNIRIRGGFLNSSGVGVSQGTSSLDFMKIRSAGLVFENKV